MATEEPRSQRDGENQDFSEVTINGLRVPERYRGIFIKAQKSRSAAVHANCLACANFYREVIRHCATECTLYPFRPYKPKCEL